MIHAAWLFFPNFSTAKIDQHIFPQERSCGALIIPYITDP